MENFIVYATETEIVAVLFQRRIFEEGMWEKGDLKIRGNNELEKFWVIYPVKDLIGYEAFTQFYGFKCNFDKFGKCHSIETQDQILTPTSESVQSVYYYPEILHMINNN